MSKTDSDQGSIGIFEDPESIRKKIMRAVTDTEKTIKYNTKKKPGISNLLSIYSSFKNISLSEAEAEMAGKSYSAFKTVVADTLIDKLEPFREKKVELSSREVYVQEILKTGAKRAENLAQSTIVNVRKKMGIES
jgi:tryptophanyl-tRNA synthetase